MKKRLFALCSLLLAASMVFGACGTAKTNNTATTDEGTTATATTAASADATVAPTEATATTEEAQEITVMIWDRGTAISGTTNEDNGLTKWIQEQVLAACNVSVKYMAVPRSGSDDKLNVMMAGGTAPDIVFSYDQNIFGNYASNGGLTDLTAAYATYGTTITNSIGNIQYMGVIEDTQYAIMKRRGVQVPRHVTYIRKDWLDKLGLSVPTTKEELITCLRAFKDQNPGGVANVIPWGMGGSADTEKFYLNFIGSYVPALSEKDAYIYSEAFKVFADGALEGLKVMNQLYSEGLIEKDFATDTTTDVYHQELSAGNVGFILDDSTNIFQYIPALQEAVPGAQFVPLNCLETPEGNYCNPTEPLYGMYIMVPATSADKVDSCVKYLNWLADPVNAENVAYTPVHTVDAAGVPLYPTEEERTAGGYPGNLGDYNIVSDHFTFTDSKEGVASQWAASNAWESAEWFQGLYDVMTTDQYLYPTYPVVLESEATYMANVTDMTIAYIYNLICCDPAEFDALQASEYQKLVSAGLQTILDERAAYYDANVAK